MWRTWKNVHKHVWAESSPGRGASSANAGGQESVCVFKEEPGGRCGWRSKEFRWDLVSGQIMWASSILEGVLCLWKMCTHKMVWLEDDLVWLLIRSISLTAEQNQEVKGEWCSGGACRISVVSRVGMTVLPWTLIKSRQSGVEPENLHL